MATTDPTREGTARRGPGSGASRFGSVVVVGAGIAGLATALALARHGIAATVLERAPALAEVGAGLQIAPNGMAVLDALGIAERVRAAAVAASAVELRRAEDDGLVVRMGLAGRDWVFVHRPRLLAVLAEAAAEAGVVVETGTAVAQVVDADPACVTLADGTVRTADIVVGADGVRGGVRAAVGPAPAPRFTGQVAWRAVIAGDAPAVAEVHMGAGRHVVTYPLAGGLRNVVAVEARRDWTEEGWSLRGDPAVMRTAFAGVSPRLARLLARIDTVHLWALYRHPVARRWHGRHVALVGDAVHPTLPFFAQGANLALEDAWALADCLAHLPPEEALPAYQARRRDRAARIVAAADTNARVYHMRGPQRRLLHVALGLMERLRPGGAIARFDWVYDHDESARGAGG